jgi:predicted SnoaL-like aldol condensation-catalyzing enzyme
MSDPQKNKQTVLAYYNLAFNDRKPAEVAEKYGGPHYIQHNPQAADGFEAFIEFVEGFVAQFPQMRLDIKRAVAEGDLVVTHSLLKTSPEDRGTAVADFFRLEDSKIVEHWNVLQPVPEKRSERTPHVLIERTVEYIHATLLKALNQAVKWQLVPRNVADATTAPRSRKLEMMVIDGVQARRFLNATRGDRFEALYILGRKAGVA